MWGWIIIAALLVLAITVVLCKSCKKEFFEPMGDTESEAPYNLPFIAHDLLSVEERAHIIQTALPKLQDSNTLGGRNASIRNSQQAWLSHDDVVVKTLLDRLQQRFGVNPLHAESLQVVRYRPGEYYKEHHDSCCDKRQVCTDFLSKSGHRILTVLIYLNDDFEGGATKFPNLNLELKPKPGDAVVFFPLAQNELKCHPYALHAGMPVKSGEKWVCNLWFRQFEVKH